MYEWVDFGESEGFGGLTNADTGGGRSHRSGDIA